MVDYEKAETINLVCSLLLVCKLGSLILIFVAKGVWMGSQSRNPQRSGPNTPNSCGTLYYNRLKLFFYLIFTI